jgi:cytochrome P450
VTRPPTPRRSPRHRWSRWCRDPVAFSQPDVFDVGRHYCLGANLGRLETQIAVAALADRYPRLRLGTEQRLTFHPHISFRGPQVLTVHTQ